MSSEDLPSELSSIEGFPDEPPEAVSLVAGSPVLVSAQLRFWGEDSCRDWSEESRGSIPDGLEWGGYYDLDLGEAIVGETMLCRVVVGPESTLLVPTTEQALQFHSDAVQSEQRDDSTSPEMAEYIERMRYGGSCLESLHVITKCANDMPWIRQLLQECDDPFVRMCYLCGLRFTLLEPRSVKPVV